MSMLQGLIRLGVASVRAQQFTCQSRTIKRWVAPTLREIRKRRTMEKEPKPVIRSSFTDWNAQAELFAFSKRLSEDFKLPVLQQAFIHQSYIDQELDKQKDLGIEQPTVEIEGNAKLVQTGRDLLQKSVSQFVANHLSHVPADLKTSVVEYLVSNATLAKLASNLGAKELILTAENTVAEQTLADTFRAIVAALSESSGVERTHKFVEDFVCTSLSQMDWAELWQLENPLQELQNLCASQKMAVPEARLIGQCGTSTLLASYNVGIYCDKKMIGSGFGETVDVAISQASVDALRGFYNIRTHNQIIRF